MTEIKVVLGLVLSLFIAAIMISSLAPTAIDSMVSGENTTSNATYHDGWKYYDVDDLWSSTTLVIPLLFLVGVIGLLYRQFE